MPAESCAICGNELRVRWSDTHGVGACITCGLPYLIYHYEGDTRVERPPAIAVKEEWVPIGLKYWQETHRRTFPAAFDVMVGRGGRSYSGASADEIEEFQSWLDAHRDELPPSSDDGAADEA